MSSWPQSGTVLCRIEDIEDPGSKGFYSDDPTQRVGIFVVQRDGEVFAYRNSCPHIGAPLEYEDDVFLDSESYFIQCSVHGAKFLMESGECVSGPCLGDHLKPVPVELVDGEVLVA